VLGDAVRLCTKNKKKITDLVEKYRSYNLLLSPEEDASSNSLNKLLEIFTSLTGYKFTPILSMSKFVKILPRLQSVLSNQVKKYDLEIAYKRSTLQHETFDIYALDDALRALIFKYTNSSDARILNDFYSRMVGCN